MSRSRPAIVAVAQLVSAAEVAVPSTLAGAWAGFARTGDPGWAVYTREKRITQIFDSPVSGAVEDPDREMRVLLRSAQ